MVRRLEFRKVQEVGGGTLSISLPKRWAERYGIRKGNVVSLEIRSDGALVIYPTTRREKRQLEYVIELTPERRKFVNQEIISAYLLGFDVIKIVSPTKLESGERESIKRTIRKLIGLEITEEDLKSITLQCLVEAPTVDPKKILSRMKLLVSSMIKESLIALKNVDAETANLVVERDDEVDKLYFLAVRLLRSSISDPTLAESLGLTPIECLDYRLAAALLEDIADRAESVARAVMELNRIGFAHVEEELLAAVEENVLKLLDHAFNAFVERDISVMDRVRGIRTALRRLREDVKDYILKLPPAVVEIAFRTVIDVSAMVSDIEDLMNLIVPRSLQQATYQSAL